MITNPSSEGTSPKHDEPVQGDSPQIPPQFQDKYFRFVLLQRNSKVPFEKDWQNTANYPFNHSKITKWLHQGGNIGIVLGYGVLRCIDDDTGKLAEELKEDLKDTYQERTWSGKTHFFITSDYEVNHVLKNKLGEYRAKDYEAVICPSIIENKPYQPLNDKPLKHFTTEQIKAILSPYLRQDTANQNIGNWQQETDQTKSGLEYRECIRYCKEGLRKNLTDVELKEYVFKNMGLMVKWSNAHPDYRESTFRKCLEVALKEPIVKKDSINYFNLLEALEKGVPEIEYIINPILRKGGLTIVGGDPGAKKTIFALACSLAIAKGNAVLDKFNTKQAKVLYLDYENGEIVILNRFQQMNTGLYSCEKEGLKDISVSVYNDLKLDKPEDAKQLSQVVQETRAEVVIIDSLVRCMNGDEDKASQVRILFDNLKGMMAEGISFILIHHTKKGIERKNMGSLRGSSDLGGMAEVILMLSENGDYTNVTLEKHRHLGKEGIAPFAFLLEKPSDNSIRLKYFESTPEQAEAKQLAYDDLLEWVNNEAPEKFRSKAAEEIMKKTGGHSKNAVADALQMLKKNGIIAKKKDQSPWEVL